MKESEGLKVKFGKCLSVNYWKNVFGALYLGEGE